jgi:hypothetical protein
MNALRWTVLAGRPARFTLGVAGALAKHAIGLAIGTIRRRVGSAPAEAPTTHNP